MDKIKDVCTPIQYKDLNLQYIYNRKLNEEKIKNNLEIRKEMISEISKYVKLKPIFNKLQIFNFENYEIEKNNEFLYDCELYIYIDSNDKIIHKEFHIKNRIPKNLGKNKEKQVNLNVEDCTVNEQGNIIKRTIKKEGFEEIIKNYQGEIGGGITIKSIIGIISGVFFPSILLVSLLFVLGEIFL